MGSAERVVGAADPGDVRPPHRGARMNAKRREEWKERGSAFFLVVLMSVSATVLIGAQFTTSLGKARHVELELARRDAFNAAEAGLNAAVTRVWELYRTAPESSRFDIVDALDGKDDPEEKLEFNDRQLGRSSFDVEVRTVVRSGSQFADVEFVSVGRNRMAARTLVAGIRFGRKTSEVFDHAYFINNYGWLWGGGITVNGSVRSNGNFSLKNPILNGDAYAAENAALGASGAIEGDSRQKDVAWYNRHAPEQARPGNPSAVSEDTNGNGLLDVGEDKNGNGVLDTYEFEDGYDGTSEANANLAPVEMPYLGDLEEYRQLAYSKGGTVRIGGVLVIDGVLGDHPSEGKSVALIGTKTNPIVINGPVVVDGDVVIKGYITGQGTIYTGRNVHVIDDLRYVNPPSWPKPMTDPAAVLAHNKTADMVGFAAKGSIILGDYTKQSWKTTTRTYQKPPFTQSYVADPSDADIGYVTGYDGNGNPTFHGNYTAYDGGKKAKNDPSAIKDGGVVVAYTEGTPTSKSRRYYESSFSDDFISSLAQNDVQWADGIFYTNHMVSGKVGRFTVNGALVSRDEAMIYSGSIDMNHDLRIKNGGYEFLDIYLPTTPTHTVLYWSEAK